MSQEREGPHFDDREWFKKSKDKLKDNFSYICNFQKTVMNCNKMLPEGNFECQFETLNALYKFFNVNNKKVDKTNFPKFYGTFQTKCKVLSLSETKDLGKNSLKQAVMVLQSLREIWYSIGK